GTRRRDGDADATAGTRVPVGHVRGALLVPYKHVADGVVDHRIVRRKNGAAGVTEDVGHTFTHEAFPHNLRAGQLHPDTLARTVTEPELELRSTARKRRAVQSILLTAG